MHVWQWQDDIFGVVPFLLAKDDQLPKSGLTFTAKDPITVIFSVDTAVLKVSREKRLVPGVVVAVLAVSRSQDQTGLCPRQTRCICTRFRARSVGVYAS